MATTSLSPGQQRLTPEVPLLRSLRPYVVYEASNVTAHAHLEAAPEVPKDWSGPQGYGARHHFDSAPFTLWDAYSDGFRQPTDSESRWMMREFSATAIAFHLPILIVETSVPPKPLPLTVAGVATRFVPPPAVGVACSARRPLPDDRPLQDVTGYAAMRGVADPLGFRLTRWKQPNQEELEAIVKAVSSFCEPEFVDLLCPYLIVEIRYELDRGYQASSMPRTIGGFTTVYHHSQSRSAFPGLSLQSQNRLITPGPTTHDTGDYLRTYNEICPGVRVRPAYPLTLDILRRQPVPLLLALF